MYRFHGCQVKLHCFLKKTKNARKNATDVPGALLREEEIQRNRVTSLIKRKRLFEAAKLVSAEDSNSWSKDAQAKVNNDKYLLVTTSIRC